MSIVGLDLRKKNKRGKRSLLYCHCSFEHTQSSIIDMRLRRESKVERSCILVFSSLRIVVQVESLWNWMYDCTKASKGKGVSVKAALYGFPVRILTYAA